MLLRTIENSGPFVFLVPVGGFCLHPWPVSNRKDTPCDWSLPQTILACCYTGCKRAFLCHKATVCLVNSNAGNWHRGYICVCVRVPAEGCKDTCPRRSATNEVWWPASDLYVNTHMHAQPREAQKRELSICITAPAADEGEP